MNVSWPPDRFYWSIIETPGLARAGELPLALLMELRHEIPLPIEELHAVGAPFPLTPHHTHSAADAVSHLHHHRVLVCAARRDDLLGLDPLTASLTPSALPDVPELADRGTWDVGALNLLVGEFEPRASRRWRFRRHLELIAAVLAVAALLSFGLSRRVSAMDDEALQTRTALKAILQSEGADTTDPEQGVTRLVARVAEVSQLRQAASQVPATRDAATALASLLRAWSPPPHLHCTMQSILVTSNVMTFSLTTDTDPAPLLKSLVAPPGWRLEEPRLNTLGGIGGGRAGGTDSVTRIMLEMRRRPDAEGAK